jgi:hypothetical protein
MKEGHHSRFRADSRCLTCGKMISYNSITTVILVLMVCVILISITKIKCLLLNVFLKFRCSGLLQIYKAAKAKNRAL